MEQTQFVRLTGDAIWNMVTNLTASDYANALIAVATLFLAFATWGSVWATLKIIRSQYQPCVIVYIERCKYATNMLELVVKNIGTAPAIDISFNLPEYFPANAHGGSTAEAKQPSSMEGGPLRNGMKYLAPGETWQTLWGGYGGLMKGLAGKPVELKISYRHPDGKAMPIAKSKLDVRDFEGAIWVKSYDARQTESLEKQAKHLEYLVSIIGRKCSSSDTGELYKWVYLATELIDSPTKWEDRTWASETYGLSESQKESAKNWAEQELSGIKEKNK